MNFKLRPVAALILLPMAQCVQADEVAPPTTSKSDQYALSEITVTATRTETRLTQVPASVSVVKREAFERQQAATVADVMKTLPNVDFGGGPRADGQIPTIRGSQLDDIIVLVDGARRNPSYLLSTPLFLDPFFLSRAEVARGPATIYGSGGLGGAMAFTTIAAKDLLRKGEDVGADIKAAYRSGDKSQHHNARVYGSNGTLDGLLAIGYQDFDGIKQPGGTTLAPNFGRDNSALFKAGIETPSALRFELSHKAMNRTVFETNNPQVAIGQAQMAHISQSETVLNASSLNSRGEKTLDARLYDTRTKNQRDANTTFLIPGGAALPYPYSDFVVHTTGLGAQHTVRIQDVQRLTYGVDIYQNDLTTLQGTAALPNTPVVAKVNPDGTLKVNGAYLQDEVKLGVWQITPSLRYDGYSATPAQAGLAINNHSHVSPKLSVAWQANEDVTIYSSYGQAFRAPTIWEMYMNSPTPGFRRFAPNANLQPQTDTTLEIGSHYEKPRASESDASLKLHAAIFQAKVKNLIQTVTIAGIPGAFGSTLQNQNVTSAIKTGAEVSANYQIGDWKLDAAYSRIRVVDNAANSVLPNLFSPPDKLATQLSYAVPALNVSFTWGVTAAAAQNYDSTALRRRSGYTTHDLYASWQAPGRALSVNLGVTNLGDKRYLSYQQSLVGALTAYEMGRSFNASITGSF